MRKIQRLLGILVVLGMVVLFAGCGGGGQDEPLVIDDMALNVATGTRVTLDRSGTIVADGHTLSYSWDFTSVPTGSQPLLSDPSAAKPTFVADIDGVYVARVRVADETGATSDYTITVTASSINSAPMANAGADQNVATGTSVSLDGSASSDADSDPLAYQWSLTSVPTGSSATLSDTNAARPSFSADFDGNYVFSLIVNDGLENSSADSVTITAATANSAPVANAGPDQNVATGTSVSLDGSASSDADGDPLTYSWSLTSVPTGSSATLSDSSAARPSFSADLDGNYVFSLIVNDGLENSAADSVTITAATANSAPVANAGADQNVATGMRVTLDGSRSNDADGDPLTFQWLFTSRPAGSITTLSNSRAVMPTFDADVDGNYVFSLIVSDGLANSTVDSVTITAATANSAPVANAGPDQNVTTGSSVSLNATGSSDADGDPLTYSWSITSTPSGSSATLSDTGVAMPSFTADLDGNYVFSLIVSDGLANSTVDSVTITAATANSAPVANAGPDQNVATGSSVSLDGSASSDADGDPLTYLWSITSVPAGSSATLSDTGVAMPSFTADLDGNYVFSLTVNDGLENSSADSVTITSITVPAGAVLSAATGRVWMDRNLGASQVALSVDDAAAYGDLYQWGRGTDGHEQRTSATTTTLSSSDSPGHGSFILTSSSPWDWRSPQNDNLWQGVAGTNNPCPAGFRLPTEAEWLAEMATWSSNDNAGAFASPLKLVSAGGRDYYDGAILNAGSSGYYWSSSVGGVDARYLVFFSGYAGTFRSYRAFGLSVRCLED